MNGKLSQAYARRERGKIVKWMKREKKASKRFIRKNRKKAAKASYQILNEANNCKAVQLVRIKRIFQSWFKHHENKICLLNKFLSRQILSQSWYKQSQIKTKRTSFDWSFYSLHSKFVAWKKAQWSLPSKENFCCITPFNDFWHARWLIKCVVIICHRRCFL